MVFKDAEGRIFEQAQKIKVGDKVILNAYKTGDEYLMKNKWFGCVSGINKARKTPVEVMKVWNHVKSTYSKSINMWLYEVQYDDGTYALLPHELLLKQVTRDHG